MVGEERAKDVLLYAALHGDREAMDTFDIKEDTLRRYRAECRDATVEEIRNLGVLKKISDRYTAEELAAIAKGAQVGEPDTSVSIISHEGDRVRFGVMGDTHIGSVYFNPDFLRRAYHVFSEEGIDTILHVGDVVEGMSNRAGHVYELNRIGYSAQKDYAIEMMAEWPGAWKCIDGNHDRWFIKSAGACIVKDICESLEDAEFLGHDEGDIYVNGVWVKLWHGEDGSSYATSYRIQKLIEAFTGGEKPHVLLAGHVHKQGYFFERHVHAVSTGALCTQSKWMRSTRKANHAGFWTIEMVTNDDGVVRFSPTWYPFYE